MKDNPLSAKERSLRGRLGAFTLHANGGTNTGPARAKFNERFYAGIPGDLPQPERERRAAFARRAYFAALALKSSRARSRKAA